MAMDASQVSIIENAIVDYPDYPKKGVIFKDIFAIYSDPKVKFAHLSNLALLTINY